MREPEPLEIVNIPVLTEIIATNGRAPGVDRDALIAELQTKLAARTFSLTDDILRTAFNEMEAALFEKITAKLRRDLPELIDATLREHLETSDNG